MLLYAFRIKNTTKPVIPRLKTPKFSGMGLTPSQNCTPLVVHIPENEL